jgi:hypothetical protein
MQRYFVLLLATLAACSPAPATQPTSPDLANLTAAGLRVEVEREGGLGGIYQRRVIDGDAMTYVATTHRICSVPQCQAAIDSASGRLSAEALRTIAAAALSPAVWELRADYGRTPNSADMFEHRLTLDVSGRKQSVKGDSGTFPEPASAVERAVEQAISDARK